MYKEAADNGNYPAALSYLNCTEKLNPKTNSIEYMKSLMNNMKNQVHYKQIICLHIAMYAFMKYSDYKMSLSYFDEATRINPNNKVLQVLLIRFYYH